MPVTIGLTTLALVAFAANSLLARAALVDGDIDASTYTLVRLVSGALVLVAALWLRQGWQAVRRAPGSWISATALLGYALAFSLAYLRLGAANGAVILFASVQGTMILWGWLRREPPVALELVGMAIAFAALVWFVAPGLHAPDPLGAALMVASGMSWGVYSLRGRGPDDPVAATAGNFVRAGIASLPLLGAPLLYPGPLAGLAGATAAGFALAVASGAITSGLGYVIWFAALPRLSTTHAAVLQLLVPVIAAGGAVALLGEPLTWRLTLASAFILGGVLLAIRARSLTALILPARSAAVRRRRG